MGDTSNNHMLLPSDEENARNTIKQYSDYHKFTPSQLYDYSQTLGMSMDDLDKAYKAPAGTAAAYEKKYKSPATTSVFNNTTPRSSVIGSSFVWSDWVKGKSDLERYKMAIKQSADGNCVAGQR